MSMARSTSRRNAGVLAVVGARPNFVKIAPIVHAFRSLDLRLDIVHTGQHYDDPMSGLFFRELRIPGPVANLHVGSGTHAWQTAEIMRRFEPVLSERKPALVLVIGDVNSTVACSLVAAKVGVKLGHVEAGLRSFDRTMPEEINRVVTDVLADHLFVTEPAGVRNLENEGISGGKIHLVGDVLADALRLYRPVINSSDIVRRMLDAHSCDLSQPYCVTTLHRPSNVDDPKVFTRLVTAIARVAQAAPVIFPVHPRTRKRVEQGGLRTGSRAPSGCRIVYLDPLGYLDFVRLLQGAKLLLTDSGGAQQEAFILGVPCLTLRETTERPMTLLGGMNTLVGTAAKQIVTQALAILEGNRRPKRPGYSYLDGHAAERIARIVRKACCT